MLTWFSQSPVARQLLERSLLNSNIRVIKKGVAICDQLKVKNKRQPYAASEKGDRPYCKNRAAEPADQA